ncbi:MAG: hypothetical protein UIH27_12225 [Ruminococcus sp.]|nr:hypothetical protein [Ruminococcus sp.]
MKRLERQLRTRNARPYSVKENIDYVNVVSIALTTSGISIPSRETPTLPVNPRLSTRADRGGTPIALTASGISILSRETPTLPKHPTLNTRADRGGTPIALVISGISILSRETPTLPLCPT